MGEMGSVLAAVVCVATLLFVLAARRRAIMRRMDAADASRRPRGADGIVVGAAEIRLTGTNGRAVLLLHGFNDSPQSMAYLAARLHAVGYTVHAPRLPGHGGGLREMARLQRAPAWREAVRDAYAELASNHARVYVSGQSMGGALAVLHAVALRGSTTAPPPALALLAPYLGMPMALRVKLRLAMLVEPFVPYQVSTGGERSIHDPAARAKALGPGIVTATTLQALQEVAMSAEAALPQLMVPTLYIQSRLDNRITESAATAHFAAIAAPDKRQHWLTGSGHIISADYEREAVADAVMDWFAAHG